MIVFDLTCTSGHRFEGWFGSSDEFARQQEGGLVACPACGSPEVAKAPMAPAVPRKGVVARPAAAELSDQNGSKSPAAVDQPIPPQVAAALVRIAEAQQKALGSSRWVGGDFAETSRAMHYGERKRQTIHGQATPEEARDLVEEGITVTPLLIPMAPPDEVN